MTTEEGKAKLTALVAQVAKVKTEVQKLVDAAATKPDLDPEIASLIDSAGSALQGVDDLNPDEVVPTPAPEDGTVI